MKLKKLIEVSTEYEYSTAASTLRKLMSKKTGYKEFVKLLDKTLTQDYGEFVDVLRSGQHDGKPTDEAASLSRRIVSVNRLIPTQSQIGLTNSLRDLVTDEYDNADVMFAGKAETISVLDPVITFGSGKKLYIIDGHHRWSQVYCGNYNGKIKILNIKAAQSEFADDYEYALKLAQLAIAAQVRRLPSKEMKGENLLKVNYGAVKGYINSIISPSNPGALPAFVEKTLGQTYNKVMFDKYIDQFVDFIWTNVAQMQKKNSPPASATPRDYMPQMDYAPKFKELLAKGILNYIDPTPYDAMGGSTEVDDLLTFKKSKNPKYAYNENVEKIRRIVREELKRYR